MSSTIHLSFRYVERDYVRAQLAHHGTRLRLSLNISANIILAGIGVCYWLAPNPYWFRLISIMIMIGYTLILAAVLWVIPRLAFRRDPKFRDEHSITLSPEGIHIRTASIASRLPWRMCSRVLIDADSYLLYHGSQFTVIPNRVFPDDEQQQAFERLLTEHVSEIVRRDT